ncbi:ABC transporter ATP-binding protein/permease [Christensenellaceae bacterium OttesenSCG-928-K19]|nr:ABC transporter ATP-binding protein/permease [Christensenellaceae bacterium OttesenSCG-928-K19]
MRNAGVLLRILRYMKPALPLVVLALLCAAASVGLQLWIPVLIGDAVDHIIGAGSVDFSAVQPLLVKIIFAAAASALLTWLMTLLTNKVSYATVKRMRTEVFGRLQTVPLSYIDSNAHGDIMARITTDVDQVADGLLQGFAQLFTGVATIVGTLLFMLSINPSIALVVIIITPLSLLLASVIAKRSFRTFREQMKTRGEISGFAEEMIGNQKVVRAFSHERAAQEQFEEINSRLYQSGVKSQFFSSLVNPSTRFINALVYAGVGIFGALSAIGGGISIGQLSSFLIYANQYAKPFNEISGVIAELQTAFASARRIFELLDTPEELPDPANAQVWTDARGNVQMKDITFSYTPDVKLIEGFSMMAASGQRIAIVGPTGSGKTTIINLLMRFYDPQKGTISIDGTNVHAITKDSMRALYGMVLQETWLFAGSVKENIAFGHESATEEEVIAAAKAAGAHSFIRRLPQGYDTILAEEGAISEGQRQLLAIARIMLTQPPMLILDEATSSIDTRTEQKIQQAFQKMMQGKTSFIVAHRLSTIREADLILVMRDGNIVEQGSHRELLEKHGFYAQLWNSQFEQVE